MFVAFGAPVSDERSSSISIRRRGSQITFPLSRTLGQPDWWRKNKVSTSWKGSTKEWPGSNDIPAIGHCGGFLVLIYCITGSFSYMCLQSTLHRKLSSDQDNELYLHLYWTDNIQMPKYYPVSNYNSINLTQFLEKYSISFTNSHKCIIKKYYMENLMKLIWRCIC